MTDYGSFVGNVHDEHLFIIDQPSKAKELQKVMTLTPPYLKGLYSIVSTRCQITMPTVKLEPYTQGMSASTARWTHSSSHG